MVEKEASNQFACDEAFAMYMDEKTKKIVQAAMVLDVYSKMPVPRNYLAGFW